MDANVESMRARSYHRKILMKCRDTAPIQICLPSLGDLLVQSIPTIFRMIIDIVACVLPHPVSEEPNGHPAENVV